MKRDIHSPAAAITLEGRPKSISRERLVAPVRLPQFNQTSATPSTSEFHDEISLDEQILLQVRLALHHCGHKQLRRIRTRCHRGRVVLQGSTSTYYLKQIAQEIVRALSDVRGVQNDLRVEYILE